jgi:LemA protein
MKHLKWIIPVAVVLIIGAMAIGFYNSLVSLNLSADTQWAKVEAQYQRRFDLIPGLVNSVKGMMSQEQAVFGAIAEARTRYAGAGSVNDKVQAATQMEGALARLLVVMENYPQLKSSDTVQSLMTELAGTENRISVERMRFNDEIQGYNGKVLRFPGNLFAGMFGFQKRAFFEAVKEAAQAVNVDLNLNK